MSAGPRARNDSAPLWVVEVSDDRDPRLSGGAAHAGYTSPPQPRPQALELVTVLLGATETPAADGPWRVAIAGGRRTIILHPARADGQLLIAAAPMLTPPRRAPESRSGS